MKLPSNIPASDEPYCVLSRSSFATMNMLYVHEVHHVHFVHSHSAASGKFQTGSEVGAIAGQVGENEGQVGANSREVGANRGQVGANSGQQNQKPIVFKHFDFSSKKID